MLNLKIFSPLEKKKCLIFFFNCRVRDKYDDLGRVIRNFGDTESANESFSVALVNYAKAMTLMADVKDIEVQRLQTKV